MNETPIAYDKHATELLGFRVGDVIEREGMRWIVTELVPRERRLGDRWEKQSTGELDVEHSGLNIARPAYWGTSFLDTVVLEPVVQTSVSLPDTVLADDQDAARAELEREAITKTHEVLDKLEGRIHAKRRELERRERALADTKETN